MFCVMNADVLRYVTETEQCVSDVFSMFDVQCVT